MEHPTRVLQRAWLLLLALLITLHGGLAHAQAFDRQAENARYRQWLEDFRADLQRLRQSPDPAKADIDSLFAKTIVPGSRGTQLVRTLAQAPGDSTSGEIHYAGLQRVFLAALADAVVAGDGGDYPETQAKYQKQVLRVRYMHVDGGGRLESFFNDPEHFKPYRLPAPGTLERDAYPFLLFEEHDGKLRLGGVSKEFWELVRFMDTLQYA
ncbi:MULTISPECIES: hypothetical protein [Achromobacter]|uniref:hypothetical protein n=1 Tax=Achromobacter TaxID=222 RepID=UPI00146959C1|nr:MULTISPECIES: hypothetical protein [Achromobacter]MBD9379710.1 hypothetical protein [Achromobacter sp. ACM02]MBD9473169.1 hypothetical protein [Achromobacter sp. ACM01]CAB3838562.1 hypothetical protein LMG26854_02316 [Achromobacter aegrifaciens]CAB3910730.1 hypothetical protein LMG3410_04814 [Achromobacter aegrifaciens]